ncbi:MAG: LacI family DNA-binding transcriptional regulator [Verrucomicrobiota bacterium]|nr:LacI family DNA-binding transcriptional regulator [Verrucomicrobiota bacterium]
MVTQEQVARKLGFSRQLVTLALAGYPHVAEASRRRILAAARSMGYRPNPHARALKAGRTGIVALWVPDQISSHYTQVAREMNRRVKQARHELIISEVGTPEAERLLSHVPVDGIFAVDAPDQVRRHLRSPDSRVPVISLGAECCARTDFVRVDLDAGTRAVMRHLIGSGYRRIVHATFMHPNHPYAGRRTVYTEAMRRAGLKAEFFLYPLSEQQRGIVRRGIRRFIRRRGAPEAIFCHSDDVALGIYRGLCDLKLRVPEDVALAGCDGIQDTEYLECPITTLVQPVADMCAEAWEFLEKRLKQPQARRQRAVLKPQLVVRASSLRPVRGARRDEAPARGCRFSRR